MHGIYSVNWNVYSFVKYGLVHSFHSRIIHA